mmetsp:Transcript_25742/g.29422  ORF Transcript_25742/g.29422 Transcript_25742/m.29422 type:complete len:182 (-) Transcript_25742:7-552(-)
MIDLNGNNLYFEEIVEDFRFSDDLEILRLGGASFSNDGHTFWAGLCEGVRMSKGLKELDLSEAYIEKPQFLFDCLQSNKSLHTLKLEKVELSGADDKALGQALRFNSTLKYLSLRGSQIGDEGVCAVLGAVKYNTNIRGIDLTEVEITEKGYTKIREVLEKNPSLEYIHFTYVGEHVCTLL